MLSIVTRLASPHTTVCCNMLPSTPGNNGARIFQSTCSKWHTWHPAKDSASASRWLANSLMTSLLNIWKLWQLPRLNYETLSGQTDFDINPCANSVAISESPKRNIIVSPGSLCQKEGKSWPFGRSVYHLWTLKELANDLADRESKSWPFLEISIPCLDAERLSQWSGRQRGVLPSYLRTNCMSKWRGTDELMWHNPVFFCLYSNSTSACF